VYVGGARALNAGADVPASSLAPTVSDTIGQPILYFALKPTDCARTDPYTFRKSVLRLQLVDERSPEADRRADLRKS
jgi:hypothetical protein